MSFSFEKETFFLFDDQYSELTENFSLAVFWIHYNALYIYYCICRKTMRHL